MRETIIQTSLLIGILAFALTSVQLITVVYTITPLSFFGEPIEVNVNFGIASIAIILVLLSVLVWRIQNRGFFLQKP